MQLFRRGNNNVTNDDEYLTEMGKRWDEPVKWKVTGQSVRVSVQLKDKSKER